MEILSGFNSTPQVLTHFQACTSYNSSLKPVHQSLFSYVTSVTLSQTSYNFDVLSTKLNKYLGEPLKHCLKIHNKTAA
jgi:hypothetical protein